MVTRPKTKGLLKEIKAKHKHQKEISSRELQIYVFGEHDFQERVYAYLTYRIRCHVKMIGYDNIETFMDASRDGIAIMQPSQTQLKGFNWGELESWAAGYFSKTIVYGSQNINDKVLSCSCMKDLPRAII